VSSTDTAPSWPSLPGHGLFVTLPLSLPPTLLDAVGYHGTARYVALWHLGDDVMVSDAAGSRTGRWRGFGDYIGHPLDRALLGPYRLIAGEGGGDPYIEAPHRLLVDRWERTVAVGESADVEAFIRSQPNELAALTHGVSPEVIEGVVEEYLRRPPVVVDVNDMLADMAAAAVACEELNRWLDLRLGEVQESGADDGSAGRG
jgi:hypothetical protein